MTATSRHPAPLPPSIPPRKAWVERIMGMPVSIHLRGGDVGGAAAAAAVADAFGILREMERIFSTYRDDSDIMRLRREELRLDECHRLVPVALELGEQAEQLTAGAFTTLLPSGQGELAFDPTGLVKGWAVDLASQSLGSLQGTSHCLNAGGDLVVGAHPDLPDTGPGAIAWRVGIEDPRNRSTIARTVRLTRGAVATSGTAARGAHIYDPRSGRMVSRAGSVTVTGPTLLWADVWATALFVGGDDTRAAFVRHAPDYLSTSL